MHVLYVYMHVLIKFVVHLFTVGVFYVIIGSPQILRPCLHMLVL